MRYILDTHALLWLATDDPSIGKLAKAAFLDNENEIFFLLLCIFTFFVICFSGSSCFRVERR